MGLACLGLAWRPRSDQSWRRAVPGGARALRPVLGLGIAVPALVLPVLAAIAALLLAPTATAAVAYISGSLGALIGGDLLHLRGLRDLGAGVASIVAPAPLTGSF